MKKFIAILLVFCFVVAFAACGKNKYEEDDGKALETAETYISVSGNSGSMALDANLAKSMLEIFPKENLGLTKDISEYELKLSVTRFMENDACLVEAFDEEEESPEGTFVISGQDCFVYNPKTQKYMLLTADGVVEVTPVTTENAGENQSTTELAFDYDPDNNQKLQERFSSYSKEKLGIEKELTEYILVAPGTTTAAENGETIYIVRLYEKNGDVTNYTLAFNESSNYIFDYSVNKYIAI